MAKVGLTVSADSAKKAAVAEMLEKYYRNPGYRATKEDYRKLLRIYL